MSNDDLYMTGFVCIVLSLMLITEPHPADLVAFPFEIGAILALGTLIRRLL